MLSYPYEHDGKADEGYGEGAHEGEDTMWEDYFSPSLCSPELSVVYGIRMVSLKKRKTRPVWRRWRKGKRTKTS